MVNATVEMLKKKKNETFETYIGNGGKTGTDGLEEGKARTKN